jgi:hypothetical protein
MCPYPWLNVPFHGTGFASVFAQFPALNRCAVPHPGARLQPAIPLTVVFGDMVLFSFLRFRDNHTLPDSTDNTSCTGIPAGPVRVD